jgi:hypothetical protein
MSELPPCGLYRTLREIGTIPVDRLVYFHNHGDPGAGVYFPERWVGNRASFAPRGTTMPDGWDAAALKPLPAEGFYRVLGEFHCCAKQCVKFVPDQFVQLGYNGAGRALLFQPELGDASIAIPERGILIDDEALVQLAALKVAERARDKEPGGSGGGKDTLRLPRGIVIH